MVFEIIMEYLPLTAICFVISMLLYKFYIKFRSLFDVRVNCWFCNKNFKVPYKLGNSWMCPSCDQYNGFNEDGGYNKIIPEQYKLRTPTVQYAISDQRKLVSCNGLCTTCNENQRLIIEKLSQFEPKTERNFMKEFAVYKASVENQFRLCVSCERYLRRVLHEKKKMVLGSKVVELVKDLSAPEKIRNIKSSRLVTLLSCTLLACSVINLMLTIKDFMLIGNGNPDYFHKAIISILLPVVSFGKSIYGEIQSSNYLQFLEKLYLYITTLASLSLGGKTFCLLKSYLRPSIINTCSTCYAGIVFSFIRNLHNGLKFGKTTLLLTVWSIYATVATNGDFYGSDIVKVITSMVTLYLSVPNFSFWSKGTVLQKKIVLLKAPEHAPEVAPDDDSPSKSNKCENKQSDETPLRRSRRLQNQQRINYKA